MDLLRLDRLELCSDIPNAFGLGLNGSPEGCLLRIILLHFLYFSLMGICLILISVGFLCPQAFQLLHSCLCAFQCCCELVLLLPHRVVGPDLFSHLIFMGHGLFEKLIFVGPGLLSRYSGVLILQLSDPLVCLSEQYLGGVDQALPPLDCSGHFVTS